MLCIQLVDAIHTALLFKLIAQAQCIVYVVYRYVIALELSLGC